MQGIFGTSRRACAEEELRQAKHLAEDSQKRTRLVVDSAYDAYIAMDAQGVVIDWNRQAERIFGWPRNQAVGQILHELIIPPPYRTAHMAGVRHFLASRRGAAAQSSPGSLGPTPRRQRVSRRIDDCTDPLWLRMDSSVLSSTTSPKRKQAEEEMREASGCGRGSQPGQERVPGQHEPRDPHAHERHHRHDRTGPGHAR